MRSGPIFADASFYIALWDPRDQWHAAAVAALDGVEAEAPFHTHLLAVGEAVAVIGGARGGKAARDGFAAIMDTAIVHAPSLDEAAAAMQWVVRSDGALSLSDALFLSLMKAGSATRILSFDGDFDGNGIERLPGDTTRRGRRRR